MKTINRLKARFAICVDNSDYPVALDLRKLYRVIPDEDAKKDGDLRIIDESGEDYLYPADYFLLVDMPRGAAQSLNKSFAATRDNMMEAGNMTSGDLIFLQKIYRRQSQP